MSIWAICKDVMMNEMILGEGYYKHFHSCPECYEHHECAMNCTIEPDLSLDGKPFGSHCKCDSCEQKSQEDEKYKTKEFWLRYNGFIK